MTLAIRFIPNAGRAVIYSVTGRAYRVTGTTVDIPFPDAISVHDQATKLMVRLPIGLPTSPAVSAGHRARCMTQRSAPRYFWFRARTRRGG
jgi:hypothetical protein